MNPTAHVVHVRLILSEGGDGRTLIEAVKAHLGPAPSKSSWDASGTVGEAELQVNSDRDEVARSELRRVLELCAHEAGTSVQIEVLSSKAVAWEG